MKPAPDIERLFRLADAYGVGKSNVLADVADNILDRRRPQITDGEIERGAVIGLLSYIVGNVELFAALETEKTVSEVSMIQMEKLVRNHGVSTTPRAFVLMVHEDVRNTFIR